MKSLEWVLHGAPFCGTVEERRKTMINAVRCSGTATAIEIVFSATAGGKCAESTSRALSASVVRHENPPHSGMIQIK